MILKTLELQGFKSFPDKTVLRFDRGATVIVGPNGSGKSNISDAMKWVLGELSSKNLRGNRMEDVIFGGTDTRRQMGYAEVTVTFDNSESAGVRLVSDCEEVSVTRRYYRAGESEYYINKKPVRLKDIHELFMNTGIGRDGYSIIGQGRIAEIVSQKSEDRRAVFEEAAGISKYRFKKMEAEKKLLGVEENLLRAQDILNELSARVGPLEKDAEKAKIYLSLYGEKKQLDVSLWLFDMDVLREKIETLKNEFLLSKGEYDRAGEELTDLENRSDRLYTLAQENKAQAEKCTELLSEIAARRLGAKAQIGILENEIEHIDERLGQTDEKQTQRHDFLEKARAELTALQQKAQAMSAELVQAKEALAKSEKTVEERDRALDGAWNAVSEAEERIAKALADQGLARGSAAVLEETKITQAQRAAQNREAAEQVRGELALLTERCEKAQKAIAAYEEKAAQSDAAAQKVQELLQQLAEKRQALAAAQNEYYLAYTEKKNRIEALSRMEELFEGYSRSVRFIMNAYGQKKLRCAALHGPVSKLISVQQRFATAVETAFGGNMQNIVVQDEESAKEAIRYLKEQNGGRATFYPIETVRAQRAPDISAAKGIAGFLGTVSEHVDCAPEYREVVDAMIGKILIADTIESAAKVAKAMRYTVRVVTLDGQQVNAGGSFTGGSLRQDSGLLTRAAQIEALRREMNEFSEKIKKAQREDEALAKEEQTQKDALATEQMHSQMLRTLQNAEQTQLQVLKTQADAEQAQLDTLAEQSALLQNEEAAYFAQKEALSAAQQAAELAARQAQEQKEECVRQREALASELAQAQKEQGRLQVSTAELQKDTQAAQLAAEQMRQSIESAEEKFRAASDEKDQLAKKRSECVAAIEQQRASEQAENENEKQAVANRAAAQQKSLEYEQKQTALREQMKDKTHEKELLFRQYTKAEANHAAAQNERDKRTGAMWDEYELTLSSALNLDYPPLDAECRPAAAARLAELRGKIKQLGTVHVGAIEEYAAVKERYDFLSTQVQDLNVSKEDLAKIIYQLEQEMRTRFSETFEQVNTAFREVFRELFGGGHAELRLTEPENVLASGIQINVAPPGKIIKNLMLLSGGEQAFVAIALYFALLRVNPAPFCILDEIEAALDEVNVDKFASYLKRHSDRTQFIVITHRRGTMEMADRLYGVTMQEKGISTVLAVQMSQVGNYLK